MLSRFPDLAVIARNSSFTYKGKPIDVRQVGRELGVQYVLEGSMRKEAEKVRIVAQLVDARSGEHVWAERYDKEGSDPWALQDEVTEKIIASLTGEHGRVRQAEYRRAWGKDTTNLEEYDYYLRGHELFFGGREDLERAGGIWSEGLQRFPESSLLRVKLGWYHLRRVWSYWSPDAAADLRKANELAREALSGRDLSPQVRRLGHWLTAWLRQADGDFEHALSEAEAAIALAPYDSFMVGDLAGILATGGKPKEAIARLEELKHHQGEPNRWALAVAYYIHGQYERVVDTADQLGPDNPDRYVLLAGSYVRLGRLEEARAAVKKLLELDPQFSPVKLRDNYVYSDPAILGRQMADLAQAGLMAK